MMVHLNKEVGASAGKVARFCETFFGISITRGVVSRIDYNVYAHSGVDEHLVLQVDAAINPGNSGGPMVDIAGKLVGISSVKMSFTPQGVPTQGIGFAIPGSVVREKVEEFRKIERGEKMPEKPSLMRRFFGIAVQDVDEKLAASSGFRESSGVLITDVEAKSPAAAVNP
jgi:S1-C subfamily serine protease